MPGQTRSTSNSIATDQPRETRLVNERADLSLPVWLGTKCYHSDRGQWGPGCPEHLGTGSLEKGTLADAAEEGLRPCPNCKPADYRRVETDGGEDNAHGSALLAQLKAAENDEDLDDEGRERFRKRREELEREQEGEQ